MKKMIAFIGLFFLLLGGCQMNQDVRPKDIDPENLPDVPAFQDAATREFLVSTEEVEPGLYLMESKLEGFQMWFPAGGVYFEEISSITNDGNVEVFTFTSFYEDQNIELEGQIRYHRNQSYLEKPDFMLDSIKNITGYQGKFDSKETSEKNIYYGEEPIEIKEPGYLSDIYGYVGYMESKQRDYLAIDYNFTLFCYEDNANYCKEQMSEKKELAKKLIDSITFIYDEEDDHDE
ncbi:hypothetical protein [Amphibacillus cookii]|uniref:hypothetical protein n=1 Tax=Amphibacillus cookii TaxID=767787 RepID=UPI00195677B0|nr:hypothetical protein [Amphibacillus cookii]MBM7540486.1 hypothetical protein [Amphibacillus cookii]